MLQNYAKCDPKKKIWNSCPFFGNCGGNIANCLLFQQITEERIANCYLLLEIAEEKIANLVKIRKL